MRPYEMNLILDINYIFTDFVLKLFLIYKNNFFMLQLYKASDQEEEKDRILVSFSAITDESIIDDVLKFTQSVSRNFIQPKSCV